MSASHHFLIERQRPWLWAVKADRVGVAGWFYDADLRPARQVRIRLGNRVVPCAPTPPPRRCEARGLAIPLYFQIPSCSFRP